MNATLLIEIGTEELPPQHLNQLSHAFAEKIALGLKTLGLNYQQVEHFVTPRRIAARFSEVPAKQPSQLRQKKGPSYSAAFINDKPTPAAIGFARSCQVELEQLSVQQSTQGAWLVYEYTESGKPLAELLPHLVESALNEISAKKMRWSNQNVEFLRPIHWITAMHGTQALSIVVFGLKANNITYGHRIHHPQPLTLSHADDYVTLLRQAKVIVDYQERQQTIRQAIENLAQKNQGLALIDEALLDQVSGLVEWPVALAANFAKAFLTIPPEALISAMQNHQKCFALKNQQGELLPTFILISNIEANPPTAIIRGNERVMQARLADAKFFYEQDLKLPLSARCEDLKKIRFQEKLGTLFDKSQRIKKLAAWIGQQIGASTDYCQQAAKLAKADLLTSMVYEFPELQGIMGSYYAKQEGAPLEVAQAIRESYHPRFAKDTLPTSKVGICLSLADRLDSLVGSFGIGQIPSGDKDPFGLRRQALAILRILIEKSLSLDLTTLCLHACQGYEGFNDSAITQQVVNFCFERFRAYFQEQGINAQTLEAVLANHSTNPYECSVILKAVTHFKTLPEAAHLAAANKRVRNILTKNEFSLTELPPVDPSLLKEPAEKNLYQAIETLKIKTAPLIQQRKYQAALVALASLQQIVDDFFDQVMVMTEEIDLRKNRLHLLHHLFVLFSQTADISRLAL